MSEHERDAPAVRLVTYLSEAESLMERRERLERKTEGEKRGPSGVAWAQPHVSKLRPTG